MSLKILGQYWLIWHHLTIVYVKSFLSSQHQSPIARNWWSTIQWLSITSRCGFSNKISRVSLRALAVDNTGRVIENSSRSRYYVFSHYCMQFSVICLIGNFSCNDGIDFIWPYFVKKQTKVCPYGRPRFCHSTEYIQQRTWPFTRCFIMKFIKYFNFCFKTLAKWCFGVLQLLLETVILPWY